MSKTEMTELEQEYADRILNECSFNDIEANHVRRDELVEEFLRKAGYERIATAAAHVEKTAGGFWYA